MPQSDGLNADSALPVHNRRHRPEPELLVHGSIRLTVQRDAASDELLQNKKDRHAH